MWFFDAPVEKAKETVLLYTYPRVETEGLARQHITEQCNRRLGELYGDEPQAKLLLEQELAILDDRRKNYDPKDFFRLWIMEEIGKLSAELGFPVVPCGLMFSMIGYLLGISLFDPLHTGMVLPPEMIWRCPLFQLEISSVVRPRIADRLEALFGRMRGNCYLFDRVDVQEDDRFPSSCNQVGAMIKKYNILPGSADFDEAVYQRAAIHLVENKLKTLDDPDGKHTKVLHAVQVRNVRELVRFASFLKGYPELGELPELLGDPNFLVLREEIFPYLKESGVPFEESEKLLGQGMFHVEKTKESLRPYHLPDYVMTAIDRGNRNPYAAHSSWVQNACILAWYEVNGYR